MDKPLRARAGESGRSEVCAGGGSAEAGVRPLVLLHDSINFFHRRLFSIYYPIFHDKVNTLH